MSTSNQSRQARIKRKKRIRKKLQGSTARPRLCVFRSSNHIYVQIIDDIKGHTLVSASSIETGSAERKKMGDKTAVATHVGKLAAERAIEKGVKSVVFDRNGFLYHGRI